ncbi:glycine betaine/proline transport system permease protein [Lachnotalea glycerini]|jgi:glycine betaine/proline transport system permease protein|uniref:Glycine betaine/proline transport system permease protein n=1 Tax=Lachnotalea glycerini TaxID=1763509 RepID=A0A318EMW7_9FIRM|nr:proline/glycine betaine ABC transporter permease [Lachnotalea glycerini]OYO84477.1 glycine/betaine ABC transporter [Lachnotalea glycerini]PXV89207.1 glycine betaine/proline transport system permease protein [Lachnotalea glycerini]RDY31448.1 proline/glycine betaine ABC transporter permease [Lachnotalea glycerini]
MLSTKIPIGAFMEKVINWMTINFSDFFDGMKAGLSHLIEGIEFFLNAVPILIFILVAVFLAWWIAGKGIAVFTGVGLLLIQNLTLWKQTMQTLALVSTSTLIALMIGLPLGILMAKNDMANKIIRPILDFMQTMPAFVYLIPAVYFFDLGTVPGAVATIIFAMPPIVRLTNLGIRQVPKDIVEASRSFGATSMQLLYKVQIPLAIPTILAGLNQTIMLSLSMVVISAMIGAEGLGNIVLQGITQMKVGKGFEGGLAVVIIAMILDRVTQCLGKTNSKSGRVMIKNLRNRQANKN